MNSTLCSQPFCRLTELRTYQGLAHGVEPTLATGNFAATRWIYHAQRGWLIEKCYQDDKLGNITWSCLIA